MRQVIFVFIFLFVHVYCALPPSFPRCQRKQEDFDECFQKAVQTTLPLLKPGFKEINMPPMEPLFVPELDVDLGVFKAYNKNVKFHGLTNSVCSSKFSFEKKIFEMSCVSPEFYFEYDYNLEGKLLGLPISGRGRSTLKMTRPKINITFHLEEYSKKNKKFYKSVKTDFSWKPENMIFDFKSSTDDSGLAGNLNKIFNDNWQAILEDVGKDYEEVIAKLVDTVFNRVMAKVTILELFGEE